MQIKELARRTGIQDKTIRYYESISVLPEPARQTNGYRDYDEADVERLKLVAGARRLGFTLDDITEILALRDRREAPCHVVLQMLEDKEAEIAHRIAELERLKRELRQLHDLGLTFPRDDVDGKDCVCHLVSEHALT